LTRQLALPSLLVALLAALVLAQPAAAGTPTPQSNIDSPSDGTHVWADQNSSAVDFTVHGTAGDLDHVDINCYTPGGGLSTLASNVPVAGGEFSTQVTYNQAYSDMGSSCLLRAVPHGDTSTRLPGDSSDPFQGPQLVTSWDNDGGVDTTAFDFINTGLTGAVELEAAGQGGLATSQLLAPVTLEPSDYLFEGNGYFYSGSMISVDGQEADLASFDAGAPGVPNIEVHKTFDPATGAMTISDREPLVKCTTGSCTAYESAGVELNRSWRTSNEGQVVWLNDSWSSTDGSSHNLDVDYAQGFHTSNANGAFMFPGSSGFQDYAQNDSVAIPHGPGTVFVKEDHTTPDGGDPTHPQGALTYTSAPDTGAVFASSDQTTPHYSEWDSHYIRTIPAGGRVAFRFSFAQAYALSDVQTLAQQALASFAPAIAITSPADGSKSTAPTVTVGGTATTDSTGLTSFTVNGHDVPVDGHDSWQTPVTLTPGQNTITAAATDADGLSSQKQITVAYVPPSPPAPVAHLSLRTPHATSKGVTFRLSCTGSTCKGGATLTAIELIRKPGGKLVGVAARKVRKTVTVGRVSFSIRAGGAKTVSVKLNATGRKLLKRYKRVPLRLTVKYKSAGRTAKLPVRKVTVKAKHRR
jgi:glucodextranase-like protein